MPPSVPLPLSAAPLARRWAEVGAVALVLAAAVALAAFYLRVFVPKPYEPPVPAALDYEAEPMQRAVDPERVQAAQAEILALGNRFLGQPGATAAADQWRDLFTAAGLEVYEHHLRSAAPVTEVRALERVGPEGAADPAPLPGVTLYPFFPNHLQPPVTGPEGITGVLLRLDPETLRTRTRFDDAIGVLDTREGAYDPGFGFNWVRYARLGLKALIVTHRDGLDHAPWLRLADRYAGMVSSAPVNYVRVAADPAILDHLGQTVRLRLTVRWRNVPHRTVVGVLRAPGGASEALLLPVNLDAFSILPDRAVGSLGALALAYQRQLLEGFTQYRDGLRRDVVFLGFGAGMMADDGLNHLLRLLLPNREKAERNRLLDALGLDEARPADEETAGGSRRRDWLRDTTDNDRLSVQVDHGLALFQNPAFLVEAGPTAAALDGLPEPSRVFFDEQFAYLLNTLVLEDSEPLLQAKIEFERDPELRTDTPAYRAYLEAKRQYQEALHAAGRTPAGLLAQQGRFAATRGLRGRAEARFRELTAHHAEEARRLRDEGALLTAFDRYRNFLVVETAFAPAAPGASAREVLSFKAYNSNQPPVGLAHQGMLVSAAQRLGRNRLMDLPRLQKNQGTLVDNAVSPRPGESSTMWCDWGYGCIIAANLDRRESFARLADPVDHPFLRDLSSLRHTFAVTAEWLLAVAHGNGPIRPSNVAEHLDRGFLGQVLVSNVGQAIVPSYPLAGALVGYRSFTRQGMFNFPGYYNHPFVFADPYGRYVRRHNSSDFPVWWRVNEEGNGHSPLAAGYDAHGFISHFKDEGEDGQRLFKSVKIPIYASRAKAVTIVTFRATPVTLLDLTNPQTMKDYSGVQMVDRRGLARFRKYCAFEEIGLHSVFLEPARHLYALLQSGAPGNDLVKVTRGFLLGQRHSGPRERRAEIDGAGYLARDHPLLLDVPVEVAASMAYVNENRLDLQERHGLADERTRRQHERGREFLRGALRPGQPAREAANQAREAVVCHTLNHPVLRENIYEAVVGILWYLGLLVPFVFFFEKLVFCQADVRRQLAAQAGIFLTVFLLLRLLHPAFAMVRSSLMILLGFVILLITGGITLLFATKFEQNLEGLRRRRGRVTAAEVNPLGVMGTAFLLGLNNMNRRKVRTGLTCATLTLLTFVMICFTSTRDDLVDSSVAVGKAPYQGFLVKRERFGRVSDAEILAFREKYGDRYQVAARRMYIGQEDWNQKIRRNPALTLERRADGVERRAAFDSILSFDAEEPLAPRIEFLTRHTWFTPAEQFAEGGPLPLLIPDRLAARLGLTAAEVDAGRGRVALNGVEFRVVGIFRAESLDRLRDLDGRDLRPFDIEAMTQVVSERGVGVVATDEDPRIPAERLVLAPNRNLGISVATSNEITRSVAVAMPAAGFREAAGLIENFLTQTGQPVYYGLDGVSFRGEIARKLTLSGMVDLLIPLLIAGLTVLNTMKGSVYERRGEIYVYNAVGIAPRHIFLMFFAEAFVYAVVGCVLGYLLSQGTGRVLGLLDLTGGLNLTFASVASIQASLTISAAVFLSTWFPARSALEIAAPAEESGWSLPEPDGDELAFDLPFNFRFRGRVAILSFFDRFLREHGEGGAGRFSASPPEPGLGPDPAAAPLPQLRARIWLKPFDLGVSQDLLIELPPDPETGLYKARVRLLRLSGTRESWMRLNRGFVRELRRHFLHWRAVSEEARTEMFEESRVLLERAWQRHRETSPS